MPLRSKRVDRSLSPRAEASRLITALTALFEGWILFEQVRSLPGLSEAFRFADALALLPDPSGWVLDGFEVKRTRQDWTAELAQPEKSAPFRLWCRHWWLVVPCPWKKVVLTLEELPDLWGLIEVDGREARVVVQAGEHYGPALSEEVKSSLVYALGRRGAVDAEREDAPPLRQITRPRLAFGSVGLECGHVVPKPMDRVMPRSVACLGCAAELPTDLEIVEAVLRDVDPSELERLAQVLDARRAARGAA